MKKFKYSQESYLKYIEFLRNQAAVESKKFEKIVNDIKGEIMRNKDKIKNSFIKNANYGTDSSSIFDVRDNHLFIQQVQLRNSNLNDELNTATKDYQEKMQKLIALQQELKALEKHKEKKKNEHKKQLRKKEQKNTDEINSLRYGERRE